MAVRGRGLPEVGEVSGELSGDLNALSVSWQ